MSGAKRSHKGRTFIRRRAPFINERESFLIICQGENTEPIYFKSFRLTSAHVKTISYPHYGNIIAFVKAAIEYKTSCYGEYDNYWIVFDKDESRHEDFNQAIRLAGDNGFLVAYSNQAFEFWFILHFGYHLGPMDRETYQERLKRYLNFEYNKERKTCLKLYDALLSRQSDAIKYAEKVLRKIGDHSDIASEESSTTVHLLVKSLNRFLNA